MIAGEKSNAIKNKINFMLYKNETLEMECAKLENDMRSLQRKKLVYIIILFKRIKMIIY